MFLVRERWRLRELENELKELVPLSVRNQNFAELANHVSDIFLDNSDRLLLEAG